jgi:quinoprotein glucose dehydrogenase
LKWYFQGVHHDTWDYDFEAAPVLMEITREGRKIPALAEVSKQGFVYILDRRDGKPVFGMEERPVPKGDVPGEEYWPTEPFPVKPPPLARMSFKPEEIARVTPEQEKFCTELYRSDGGLHNDGPFTRYGLTGSIVFPGTLGASNWHGASYSPDLGYLFVNIMELADIGKLEKREESSPLPYSRSGYARFWNPDNFWPCQAPPWGEMAAVNVNTGEIAWKVPFGVVEELESKGIHNTGAPNIGGSIATAGGLVFIGATNDHRFRAFDGKTGKVVWETKLESGAYATPITYLGKDGKQYIVVSAGGGSYYDRTSGDSVIAFALP